MLCKVLIKSKSNVRQQQQVACNFSEQSNSEQLLLAIGMTLSRGWLVLTFFFVFKDYILAYEIEFDKDAEWQQKREEKRREFEGNLEKANLELEAEGIEVRVHVAFTLYNNLFIV